MSELGMDQLRSCLVLAEDFIAGQWESILVSHRSATVDPDVEKVSVAYLCELFVALSPAQLYVGDHSLPALVVEQPSLALRYRYCAGLLLNALAGLSLRSSETFDAQVKFFCIALSDLLEVSGSFSFVAHSFLRADSSALLSHSLRRFHFADTCSRQGLLPGQMSIVLGMHRSGTSALSGMLAQVGLDAPKDALGATENNLLGYWESEALVLSADAYIESHDSHWSSLYGWPDNWVSRSSSLTWIQDYLYKIHKIFDCSRHVVLKDPRLCILIEAFIPCLSRSIVAVDFLLMLRSPVEVVVSLCCAEKIDAAAALHLWIGSVLRSERVSRFYPRRIFTYSQLLESPEAVLASCCSLWGLNQSDFSSEQARSFIRPSLHRQKLNLIRQSFLRDHPSLAAALQLAEDIYLLFGDHDEIDTVQLDQLNRRWLQMLGSN